FRLTPDAEDIGSGAFTWVESEELDLVAELATTLARMRALHTPILTAVIGERGSRGVLALAVADRVIMLEGTIHSVTAPEGAAAILYLDAGQTPRVSRKLKLTACNLENPGVVDEIAPDPEEGAYADPATASALLAGSIAMALAQLQRKCIARIVQERYDRYRRIGTRRTKRPRPDLHLPRRRRATPRSS
ncbi:MAG TPA: hypothetical protein VK356_08730, partial [Thermomicrobiales bacterium]|nr:hypothetical protein [Thermomicrobiales bacterium]